MIVITFSFLGKDVKIIIEGNHCIDKTWDNNPKLQEIIKMNNSLLNKDGDKFKEIYDWCKIQFLGKFKKGRDQSFYF